jgi:hypothetical protein
VAGVVVVRADTGNVPVVMRDVPVAVAHAVGDKDTRSADVAAAATRIHAWQVYCSDSIHSQYLLQAGRAQWDLCLHAHWHCQMMTEAVAGSCRSR